MAEINLCKYMQLLHVLSIRFCSVKPCCLSVVSKMSPNFFLRSGAFPLCITACLCFVTVENNLLTAPTCTHNVSDTTGPLCKGALWDMWCASCDRGHNYIFFLKGHDQNGTLCLLNLRICNSWTICQLAKLLLATNQPAITLVLDTPMLLPWWCVM